MTFRDYFNAWKNINFLDNLEKWSLKLLKFLSFSKNNKKVFIMGNGGSAANASHIANDFTYGYGDKERRLNIECLASNSSVLSCLANDIGYDNVFSYQIENKAKKGDLVIVLSGSGNSPNILNAIKVSKKMKLKTFGILGFDGGKAKSLLDDYIIIPGQDMQLSEDMQLVIAHGSMRMMDPRNTK